MRHASVHSSLFHSILLEVLGRGASGKVRRVQDSKTGAYYAMKVLTVVDVVVTC
jgi:serine/threonine protein kinase